MQNQRSKMITKPFPIRSSRNSLDPNQSLQEGFGSGVEIVPDTFDEPHKKKRQCMDLDACIVCEVSDKCISRCCGIDCPVSFHQECLDADFGGSEVLENPFCPYCWFKIVTLKSKALRDEAIDAEKTVLKYLDKEVEREDEVTESIPECQEEDRDGQHSVESTDIVSGQVLQGEKEKATPQSKEKRVQVFDKDSDKSPLTDQPDGDKGKLEVNEASESIEDDEDDETVEDQMRVAGRKGVVAPVLSKQESFSGKEDDQVRENENRRRRRRLILNAAASEQNGEEDVTAKVNSKDAGKKGDVAPVLSTQVQQNENQRRRRRRLILNDTDSEFSSTKERSREEEEVTKEITSSTKVTNKSKTVAREISFFSKDQRRRLLWTPEEEEMLKVGVAKFAAEAKRNMPWRKVLEMGENVFHETRTPADLKDKWRNMIRLGKVDN